jgi:hypothetical protein
MKTQKYDAGLISCRLHKMQAFQYFDIPIESKIRQRIVADHSWSHQTWLSHTWSHQTLLLLFPSNRSLNHCRSQQASTSLNRSQQASTSLNRSQQASTSLNRSQQASTSLNRSWHISTVSQRSIYDLAKSIPIPECIYKHFVVLDGNGTNCASHIKSTWMSIGTCILLTSPQKFLLTWIISAFDYSCIWFTF